MDARVRLSSREPRREKASGETRGPLHLQQKAKIRITNTFKTQSITLFQLYAVHTYFTRELLKLLLEYYEKLKLPAIVRKNHMICQVSKLCDTCCRFWTRFD